MLTSEKIKAAALASGADLCGIAPMSRFDGAPDEMNPQFLFPEAKSAIGFVFRIPRGVQRGIEEGTQFYQYPSMAYAPCLCGRKCDVACYEHLVGKL